MSHLYTHTPNTLTPMLSPCATQCPPTHLVPGPLGDASNTHVVLPRDARPVVAHTLHERSVLPSQPVLTGRAARTSHLAVTVTPASRIL